MDKNHPPHIPFVSVPPGPRLPLSDWLVVFDLDGTLVDSAPGICLAANQALARAWGETSGGPPPWRALSAADVGPPLASMARLALGPSWTPALGARVAALFSQEYDSQAHLALDYPGADACLRRLASLGAAVGLATNKRRRPALCISRSRGWDALFEDREHALEDYPSAGSKASALAAQARAHPRALRAMVGDSESDHRAALDAGFGLFIHAPWGCATGWTPPPGPIAHAHASSLSDIVLLLARRAA